MAAAVVLDFPSFVSSTSRFVWAVPWAVPVDQRRLIGSLRIIDGVLSGRS